MGLRETDRALLGWIVKNKTDPLAQLLIRHLGRQNIIDEIDEQVISFSTLREALDLPTPPAKIYAGNVISFPKKF